MHLYMDDTIVERDVNIINDHNILQQDLDNLSAWSTTSLIDINVCKCVTLPITMKWNIIQHAIFGETL